jgi:epoxyqueuosine reductase
MEKTIITDNIKRKAYALGYELCGMIPVDAMREYRIYLDKRIERFPKSRHLYEELYDLGSPEKKAKWAKSIVVCVKSYSRYKIPPEVDKYFGKPYLFDGRVTYTEEYKTTALFEEYLRNLGVAFLKDSVGARLAAVKAGLGKFGKNNFLYTQQYGSWVIVDTWIVNQELEYDGPFALTEACPKNCRRCIDACPTQALCEPFAMDRGICVAQLSYFSSELPSDYLRDQMGTWLYGCDVCQDVCPKNRKWAGEREFPELESIADLLTLEKIVEMDEKTFLEKIQPRFWYIGKKRIWLWKCNAIRAMANSHDAKYHTYIRQACGESDENVRSMANWACKKLGI